MKLYTPVPALLLVALALFPGCPWPFSRSGPSAAFMATPTRGTYPLTVQFTDRSASGSEMITGWAWDFGDGNTSDAQNPSHTYATSGRFNVSLTVTTSIGSDIRVETDFIVASNENGGVEERALSWLQLSPSESFPLSLREMRNGGFLYAWNYVVDADSYLSESLSLNRIDPGGNLLPSVNFNAETVGQQAVEVLDRGVVALTRGESDYNLIKLSLEGVEQWSHFHPELTGGVDMVDTTDGGVVVLAPGASIVKIDDAGEIQWIRPLAFREGDIPSNIRQSQGGGYIVGITGPAGASLIGTDAAGEIMWSSHADREEETTSLAIHEFSDGCFGQAGRFGRDRTFVRTLDQNGIEISFLAINMDVSDPQLVSLGLSADGGLIFGRLEDSLHIGKIGADGATKWQTILDDFWEPAYTLDSVLETADGGVAVAGAYNLFSEYGRAFLLLVE